MSNETNIEQPRSAIAGIEAEADEAGMFSGTCRVVGMSVVRPVVERLEAERDALRNVCAEAYQLAGVLDAPVEALDNLAAAMTGQPLPRASFLPVVAVGQEPIGTVFFPKHRKAPDVDWAKNRTISEGMLLYARPVPAEDGIVTVTTTEDGRCVMISRQDEDHRILKVLWEAKDKPAEPVNARLLEALKYTSSALFYLVESKHGPRVASGYPEIVASRAAIAAAEAAPKAVRLTAYEQRLICDRYADIDGTTGQTGRAVLARAIETAVLRKNGIEVAE